MLAGRTMSQTPPTYSFFTRLARMINAGQSRSILLHGNVQDLFFVPENGEPREIDASRGDR